ncbi:TPA: hypothetical protein ACXDAZ_002458 [Clostridium botulinum]
MDIKRWTSGKKMYKLKKAKDGGEGMEAIKTKNNKNVYVKSNKDRVLEAINRCNKKYAKAMKELAK